jgi:hypothetical protein
VIGAQKIDSSRQEQVRQQALKALKERNLDLAISLVWSFLVWSFNEEMGIPDYTLSAGVECVSEVGDGQAYQGPSPEILRRQHEQLRRAFTTNPKILSGVDGTVLEQCRIAAGMAFLGLGFIWPSGESEAEAQLENMTLDVAGMIVSSVQSRMNLDEWRRSGHIKSVKIVGSGDGDSCHACKAAQKQPWPIQDVPELPFADCTSEWGCNCGYVLHEIRD